MSYISFLHQTTTVQVSFCLAVVLSYISFLHQTTTAQSEKIQSYGLSYISFLHQTTTMSKTYGLKTIVLHLFSTSNHNMGSARSWYRVIVLHLFSTSNHNRKNTCCFSLLLSYISFLHQTTTVVIVVGFYFYCLTSLFYIKPQL